MVDLSSDERAKVEASRRSPPPNYFDAASFQDLPISRDFEAFLILQDPATISATLDWYGQAVTLGENRVDRNSVLFEALVADSDDRSAKQSELKKTTTLFNTWKELFTAGKFSDTTEVSLIIRDFQATAEEIFVLEDRAKHLENLQARLLDRLRQGLSSAQLRELQSWSTPLTTY